MSHMSSSDIKSYLNFSDDKPTRDSNKGFSSDRVMSNFFSSRVTKHLRKKKSPLSCYNDTIQRFGSLITISKIGTGIKNTQYYECINPIELNDDTLYDTDVIENSDTDTIDYSCVLQKQGFNVCILNVSNSKSGNQFESSPKTSECLMIRTTYHPFDFEGKNNDHIGIYSPDIYVFKNNKFELEQKEDCCYINVITLPSCKTKDDMCTFLRICKMNNVDCPIIVIGRDTRIYKSLWKEVINDFEFIGVFKKIVIQSE